MTSLLLRSGSAVLVCLAAACSESADELARQLEEARARNAALESALEVAKPRFHAQLTLEFMHAAEPVPGPETELTILSPSPVPDARTVEYPNCVAMHVCQIEPGGPAAPGRALVAFAVLRGRRPLPPAAFAAGDRIRTQLAPFDWMPESVRSVQRSDTSDELELPVYAAIGSRSATTAHTKTTNSSVRRTDRPRTQAEEIAHSIRVIEQRVADHGGWDAWEAEAREYLEPLEIRRRAAGGKLAEGHRWYYRGSWAVRRPEKEPRWQFEWPRPQIEYFVAFRDQLAKAGIDFILAPFPEMEEVSTVHMLEKTPPDRIIDPQRQRMYLHLLQAGIEVVDLLPDLLAASDDDSIYTYYPSEDAHVSDGGLQVAARTIAKRLHRYHFEPVYKQLQTRPVRYCIPDEQVNFPDWAREPDTFTATQVLKPDGSQLPNSAHPSPVVICGDSYINVPAYYGPRSADLPAHLALETGILPHRFSLGAGGGRMMAAIKKAGGNTFQGRRVCIYIFREGRLFKYDPEDEKAAWQIVDLELGR